ncbi:MAG: phosphoglycerate dehydrogenase [Methylocystaceae bacterium]|nr:phosphoglycerate dehydrogenase [Methylocystaceae bacterium]
MLNTKPKKIIVTTVPFSDTDKTPTQLLEQESIKYSINPLNRKLKPNEVADIISDHSIVIAGTEPITAEVMDACPNLKAICRVGIGLDSVDLIEAKKRGITVSYTPDGPSTAVAELSLGLILDALRNISSANQKMRNGIWHRYHGSRIAKSTIGIIGMGRIGALLTNHLCRGFPDVKILANDIIDKSDQFTYDNIEWVGKDTIYKESDVISLHIPLTATTRDLIGADELNMMKPSSALVNTARGSIVNEKALAEALKNNEIRMAAVDVFEEEPYNGELLELDNIILTCHMGSMTKDCRARMEIEATEEAIRFMKGEDFMNPVPESEYELAAQMALT